MSRGTSDLEDYWNEFQDIKRTTHYEEGQEEDTGKTPDEGETELAWLQMVGYGRLTSSFEDGRFINDEDLKEEISSLTRAQRAAVRRRVDTLNATLRRKAHRQHKDVREVFQRPDKLQLNTRLVPAPILERSVSPTTPTYPPTGTEQHYRRSSKERGIVKHSSAGNYSMSDAATETALGIEILNINKSQRSKSESSVNAASSSPLPVISDDDITLDITLDEPQLTTARKINDEKNNGTDDDMPNFILIKDNLGVTQVGDLGDEDMERVRSLALIELTALFDIHNIAFSKRKGKRKVKESNIFGVPLQILVECDQKRIPHITVPLIFTKILLSLEEKGLNVEGILRVPGSASRVKNLRLDIEEKFNSGNFSWDNVRPNDSATLLKQFLRDLPSPLLTYEYIDAFMQVENIPDKKQQLQALNLIVLLLPDFHRDTLKVLLQFLQKIIDHKESNKMTVNNVAMIMAPNLFCIQANDQKVCDSEVASAAAMSNVVKMLIKYHKILWTIPSFMITQIRHQYSSEQSRKSKEKSIMNFFGKKDKSEVYKKVGNELDTSVQEGVIRIQAPHFSKSGAAIQLTDTLTAGDIVSKFRKKSIQSQEKKKSSKSMLGDVVFAEDNAYLYEIGGNIGERCIDHSANVMAIYKVNPTAEWIIKNRPFCV